MMLVVVPDYIFDDITRKLDAAIAVHPDAEKDREHLRSQLLSYLDEYGVVPDFSLAKSNLNDDRKA